MGLSASAAVMVVTLPPVPCFSICFTARLIGGRSLLGIFGAGYGRLPLRHVRVAAGLGRLSLRDIHFVGAGVQPGLFTLRRQCRALILGVTRLRVRARDIYFPIGQVDPVRDQVAVRFGLFSQAHRGVRGLECLGRKPRKLRIRLQQGKLGAWFGRGVWFYRR